MPSDQTNTHRTSIERWVSAATLAIAGTLLAVIVFYGWMRLLPDWSAAPLAFALTLLGALLAYQIGVDWHRAAVRASAEGRRWPGWTWLRFYLVLLLISALGVINTAFYYNEGPIVLKETLDGADRATVAFTSAAQDELHDRAHDEKIARVRSLLTSLATEIGYHGGSARLCGVGPYARATIAEIHKLLPAFVKHSGVRAGKACGSAQAITDSYKADAERLLAEDPSYTGARGPEREAFVNRLQSEAANFGGQFEAARKTLDAANLASKPDAYVAAMGTLESAATWYAGKRVQFDRIAGHPHPAIPASLDLSAARDLGSLMTIVRSLFRRSGIGTTYLYILLAIFADFFVLYLIKNVVSESGLFSRKRPSLWSGYDARQGTIRTESGNGPRFLWVNPE